MADVQPGDVLRITAKMSYAVGDVQNVYHVKHDGLGVMPEASAYASLAQWIDDAHQELITLTHNGLAFDTIDIWNLTQDAALGSQAWPTLTAGTGTGDAYATQVAGLVKFLTNIARSQGRKYIGGLIETGLDSGGVLSAALQSDLLNYVAEVLLPPVVTGEAFIVGNWNPVLVRFAEWLSGAVAARAGTQRRRRGGVGS